MKVVFCRWKFILVYGLAVLCFLCQFTQTQRDRKQLQNRNRKINNVSRNKKLKYRVCSSDRKAQSIARESSTGNAK